MLWLMSHTAVVTNPLFAQTGVEKGIAVRSTRILLVHRIHCYFVSLYVTGFDAELLQAKTYFFDINYATDNPCHIVFTNRCWADQFTTYQIVYTPTFLMCSYLLKCSVILSVLDPRKCEYLKDYSLDFKHAYMTTYLASWKACRY